jgi:hypothetical protein
MKIPCENCITLPMCKCRYTEIMNRNKKFRRKYLFLGSAFKNCSLIKEWYYDPDTRFTLRTLREVFSVQEVSLT